MMTDDLTFNDTTVFEMANELESVERSDREKFQFPHNLLIILKSLDGNLSCIDCNEMKSLGWASVAFGTLMCEDCAYSHIASGLGDACTSIRSLENHSWKLNDILSLLEGGNGRFASFVGLDADRGGASAATITAPSHRRASHNETTTSTSEMAATSTMRRSTMSHVPASAPPEPPVRRTSLFRLSSTTTPDPPPPDSKYRERIAVEYAESLRERVAAVRTLHRPRPPRRHRHHHDLSSQHRRSSETGSVATTNTMTVDDVSSLLVDDEVSSISTNDFYLHATTSSGAAARRAPRRR